MVTRFQDQKVERVRELFSKVLRSLPETQGSKGQVKGEGKIFYIMYADFEEKHGLINHSMKIYDRALKDLTNPEFKFELFNLHLAKTTQYFGIMSARQLFERAFGLLVGPHLIQVGLRFAKLERKMGETDRARNIYSHLSQFCNPNSEQP